MTNHYLVVNEFADIVCAGLLKEDRPCMNDIGTLLCSKCMYPIMMSHMTGIYVANGIEIFGPYSIQDPELINEIRTCYDQHRKNVSCYGK